MFLSNFSVKRPVATVVMIVAMMLIGLLALSKLKVNQNPDVERPALSVSIPYPGASPETVEREITNRIEKQLLAIQGVNEITSNSYEGGVSFFMDFNFGRNVIEASDDVRNAIAAVRYKLPIEMREPVLRRIDPAAEPVMSLALSSSTQSLSLIHI